MAVMDQQRRQPPADGLSERVRATWSAGDFARIAVSYEPGAADFIARLGLRRGERVLDVACGTGNLTLPAARAGAAVTGIDIAPALVAQLLARADSEGLEVDAREGDAEALPFEHASFDTVVSMFGVMFAAHPEPAAAELVRVTRPGGRIALASWTPQGFVGQMLRVTVGHVPPPPGMPSVLLWGDPEVVRQRLGAAVGELRAERRHMVLAFRCRRRRRSGSSVPGTDRRCARSPRWRPTGRRRCSTIWSGSGPSTTPPSPAPRGWNRSTSRWSPGACSGKPKAPQARRGRPVRAVPLVFRRRVRHRGPAHCGEAPVSSSRWTRVA